jgi:hypothetical protein
LATDQCVKTPAFPIRRRGACLVKERHGVSLPVSPNQPFKTRGNLRRHARAMYNCGWSFARVLPQSVKARKNYSMLPKFIATTHKRWVLKIAFADMPFASSMMYSPRINLAMYNYSMTQMFLWSMKVFYPILFLITFYNTTLLLLFFNTVDDIVLLLHCVFLLGWSLFIYLIAMHWLWYKKQCQNMKTPRNKRLIRFVMKKMLKLSPLYLAIHVFFFLFANCCFLVQGILTDDPFAVAILPFINLLFIIYFYKIYYWWIRTATYPLRNKLFRF